MKRKLYKKVLAVAVAASMVVGASGVSAMAADVNYNFNPPSTPHEVDHDVITAAVHRAASVMPEILGLNTSCGFSMINGTMPTSLDEAKTKLMLGAFGTDANQSPDPYYWNYFYNFWAAENGQPLSDDAVNVPEENVSAAPSGADTTIVSEYGTSISLSRRPDILIGVQGNSGIEGSDSTTGGYDALIADIRNGTIGKEYYQEGDENYQPYLVSYSMDTTYDMILTLNTVAKIMDGMDGKYGRYTKGEDSTQIARDLSDYVCGIQSYILKNINDGTIDKKKVAVVQTFNDDGTATVANVDSLDATSNVRGAEYVNLVCDNIATEGEKHEETSGRGTTTTYTLTAQQLAEDADVIITSGSNGGIGNADTDLPNTRAMLEAWLEENGQTLPDDTIALTENPDTVYGITMNSIENCMGFAYFDAFAYCDKLGLEPADVCAYFYQNFYHVNGGDTLQSMVDTTFTNVQLPEGHSTSLANYNDGKNIDSMIAEGKEFYYNAAENNGLLDKFEEAGEPILKVWPKDPNAEMEGVTYAAYNTELDATAVWQKLEEEVGMIDEEIEEGALIGSDYAPETWEALTKALEEGAVAIENKDSGEYDKEAVSTLYNNLVAAYDGLIYAELYGLRQEVEADEAISSEDYSVATFSAFSTALKEARTILDACTEERGAYSDDEIDSALEALRNAKNALVNISALRDEVATDEEIITDGFTDESVAPFKEALEAAQALLKDDANPTQEEVDNALAALQSAKDGLAAKTTKGADSLAVRRGAVYYFSYTPHAGDADLETVYGKADDVVLFGDWDGDGQDTYCVRRGAEYYFKNSLTAGDADEVIVYGRADDDVLVGDWDGDGKDTIAVRRGAQYFISNSLHAGDADEEVVYGRADDVTLAGDWDGNGTDTLAVRRGAQYFIANSMHAGDADQEVVYGRADDQVLVGDWDGNGTDTLAVRRGAQYFIANSMHAGDADQVVVYGKADDEVYAGCWVK